MDILKLLPPHNAMFKKIYILTQWCRKIDWSQSWLPWQLLTPILNCAKHNARGKHVEPHMDLLLQTGTFPAHHCSAIISCPRQFFRLATFLVLASVFFALF